MAVLEVALISCNFVIILDDFSMGSRLKLERFIQFFYSLQICKLRL
jgi:hypothetical protein